jgi:hypothetical protein
MGESAGLLPLLNRAIALSSTASSALRAREQQGRRQA